MINYKKGDVVVMNRDLNGVGLSGKCYLNEKLTYFQPSKIAGHYLLRNINGHHVCVPGGSFDLRDKPEFDEGDVVTGVVGSHYHNETLIFGAYCTSGDTKMCLVQNAAGKEIFVGIEEVTHKVEFEIDELIEASNHEDFEMVDIVYFVADASRTNRYQGDYPIVVASDMGTIQHFKYARKIVEKTYTIKYDCVEYLATKGQYDLYHRLKTQVTS
jgi:hypothetical protein